MKEIQENHKAQERKQQLAGWILFVLCAIFYIASSLRNRDALTFIGSALFLIACIFFIISLVKKMKYSEDRNNNANATDEKSRPAD